MRPSTRPIPAALLLVALLLAPGPPGAAQEPASGAGEVRAPLTVAVKPAPPFVVREADGAWSGISVELWREVARELGVEYELVERDLEEMLAALAAGEVDVGVGAVTVTAEREAAFDFSHPFFTTGLGIAVPASGGSWLAAVRGMVTGRFLQSVGLLLALLAAVGALVWLAERRANEEFGGSAAAGLGSGFWWSAVTMTTVGYGDKSPRTFAGRLLGLVWMFAGVILISTFTAAITSALTVTRLEGAVRGPEDLPRVRVATLPATTSATYLEERGIRFRAVESVAAGLDAVAAGEVDAVVYDAPVLLYASRERAGAVTVLEERFSRQNYALALAPGSELREPVNRAVLRAIAAPWWSDLQRRYLGD